MTALEISVGAAVVIGLLLLAALAIEARRMGDLLEAINHAIERVAVDLKRR